MSTKRINTFVMKVRINYTVFDKSTSLDSMESKPSKLFDSIFNSHRSDWRVKYNKDSSTVLSIF